MKKRDSAYYKKRLAKDHPALFAEVRAGSLSVRAASAKAGMIRLPTLLDALKREWKGATKSEQIDFLKWLKAGAIKHKPKPIFDRDRRLRPRARAFLSDWVRINRSRPGRIMKEIGFSRFDYTLSSAILNGTTLRPEVIPKLSEWFRDHGY